MAAPSDEGADRDGEGWKFELEDLEDAESDDDQEQEQEREREREDDRIDRSIEPGEIDPENAAFVVLGAIVAVLVFLRTAAVLAP